MRAHSFSVGAGFFQDIIDQKHRKPRTFAFFFVNETRYEFSMRFSAIERRLCSRIANALNSAFWIELRSGP